MLQTTVPMRLKSLSMFAAMGCVLSSPPVAMAEPGQDFVKARDPQYVLTSFDNSNEVSQWKRSRALAATSGARFTYFLSCVFLIPRADKARYVAPEHGAGKSNIGFAPSKEDVAERLGQIWAAHGEGSEIGSHACGHFDGKGWSKAEWSSELTSFRTILATAFSTNGLPGEPAGWRDLAMHGVRGFRAPYLSAGPSLDQALGANGFAFDASGVSKAPEPPDLSSAIARFALPLIPEGPSERRVVAMDYNLFVRHTGGVEHADGDGMFEQRAYVAFHQALQTEMTGAHRPLQLGFHFTQMNGGAYWRALERFASEACVRPDVACVTYSEYLGRTNDAAPSVAPPAGKSAGG